MRWGDVGRRRGITVFDRYKTCLYKPLSDLRHVFLYFPICGLYMFIAVFDLSRNTGEVVAV
jgi:hypothetical protein